MGGFTFCRCGLFWSERADFDVFQQDLGAPAVVVAFGVDAVVPGVLVLLLGCGGVAQPSFLQGWSVLVFGVGFGV